LPPGLSVCPSLQGVTCEILCSLERFACFSPDNAAEVHGKIFAKNLEATAISAHSQEDMYLPGTSHQHF